MRSTYLILGFLTQVLLIAIIILSPIYITPGWYWWSVIFGVIFFVTSSAMGNRIDEWNQMDRLKDL